MGCAEERCVNCGSSVGESGCDCGECMPREKLEAELILRRVEANYFLHRVVELRKLCTAVAKQMEVYCGHNAAIVQKLREAGIEECDDVDPVYTGEAAGDVAGDDGRGLGQAGWPPAQ